TFAPTPAGSDRPWGRALVRALVARVDGAHLRWLAVAALCLGCDFAALYLLIGLAGLRPAVGHLAVAALSPVVRYLLTARPGFGQGPSWRRGVQFHARPAGAFCVWWAAATALAWLGAHYLLAAAAASGCSVGVNFVAHFGWIWRRYRPGRAAVPGEGFAAR